MNALTPQAMLSETSDAEHPAFQRVMCAVSAFNELEAEEQHLFADRLRWIMNAGEPEPPYGFEMQQAAFWAGWASIAERKAYCLVAFNSLSRKDREAFLAYVTGRAS